jgi:hypothetical protein
MGVIERLAVTWEGASFALVAALVWLSAPLVNWPCVCVKSEFKSGVEMSAAIPSPGPVMDAFEDNGRESQEEDLERYGLRGLRLVWLPSLTLSQITPPQGVWLSVLTPVHRPLRC